MKPSFDLCEQIQRPIDLTLPDRLEAGGVLLVTKSSPDIRNMRVDGRNMTPLLELKKYWGVLDLNGGVKSWLLIEYEPSKPNFLAQLFYHPRQAYEIKLLNVIRKKINSGSRLRIPPSVWKKMDSKFEEQKKKESLVMKELINKESGLFSSYCMEPPLTSKVVSLFASPRTLPDGRQYFHTGLDLRARVETPITAMGRGQVVYADHMIVPGNVVVIDHGGGVFSRYMHLSEFFIKPGDFVEKNQRIAMSGATGRIEAPHLHWEVIWKGRPTNPHQFIEDLGLYCSSEERL